MWTYILAYIHNICIKYTCTYTYVYLYYRLYNEHTLPLSLSHAHALSLSLSLSFSCKSGAVSDTTPWQTPTRRQAFMCTPPKRRKQHPSIWWRHRRMGAYQSLLASPPVLSPRPLVYVYIYNAYIYVYIYIYICLYMLTDHFSLPRQCYPRDHWYIYIHIM